MAEPMSYSSLPAAFSKVVTDLADLIQKEMRLARAELSEKVSPTLGLGPAAVTLTLCSIASPASTNEFGSAELCCCRWMGSSSRFAMSAFSATEREGY